MKNSKIKFENLYTNTIIDIELNKKNKQVNINNIEFKLTKINKCLRYTNIFVNRFTKKSKNPSIHFKTKLYWLLDAIK